MPQALLALVCLFFLTSSGFAAPKQFARIAAKTSQERTVLAELGVSIDAVRSDSVWSVVNPSTIETLKKEGFRILESHDAEVAFSGQAQANDFPPQDQRFHTYAETLATLRSLQSRHADITRLISIGKTIEGREIWALQINSDPEALGRTVSGKPGAVFMGAHHAREHLTVEMPLMLAQHLLTNRESPRIARLLDTRDIWIVPMVNPDGAEFDISTGKYAFWRKNRRQNDEGSYGVDLNRNYGYKWGTGGASKLPTSDTYRGETAFSEPETRAVKEFIDARPNLKTMLSFHSFSELILYPWGHTTESIGKSEDFRAFTAMATQMAKWNHYTAEQSSDLYVTSGDTTDWAYGEHGIFAFTFELSPGGNAMSGFYPGASAIDPTFAANLQPCLYLIELADDPLRAPEYVPLQ